MSGNGRIRLVLIDDHQIFREALQALLKAHGQLEVVGEAGDARAGYAVIEATRPDVVVLDLHLPGIDGIAATREIVSRLEGVRVLILSGHSHEDEMVRVLAAGARGFASKTQSAAEIIEAIEAVARGERYAPPSVAILPATAT